MGMIDFLVHSVMLPILTYFYAMTASYGVAIIFLTIVIKAALMPLTFQSIRAQMDMQKIQPKLKELQKKYKDKPEIYNKKVIEFYKENRVNPLGGCLPILIQMPFFIGLYSTFMSEEFKTLAGHNSSFLFITDLTRLGLTHNGVYYFDNFLLIMLFGITTFISQKMMITNPDDPMQKQMLYMMPVMITFMFAFVPVPSGALLYIVVSNLITILQNIFVINKKKAIALAEGNVSISANDDNILEGDKKSINLDKSDNDESSIKDNQDRLSPVLVSAGKSKRAKKKTKKNRRK